MLSALKEQFNLFWQARAQRERNMLLICALVIVSAIIYGFLLSPALSGRKKLSEDLPVLNQKLAEINELSKQQSKLAVSLSELVPPVSREQLEASLTRRGIKAQTISVTDDLVRLQIPAAAYANLMEWLVEMQKASRLTVEEAKLVALLEVGQVSATISLKQQRSNS
ncbi:type II secretion system protein GspM [Undibacterium sp. TS12]|uniref:type II secretion system protein GspM n=1 Tax=Undibacterium sp. TS12 TaxID=2908202 RepID=UPI001F4C5864|nr:type II secretion system protein GspM [Undibacterium sp. TS12]MCH8618850.1 type II secretion system protein M [Undibacterium sp. TS12]